MIDVILPHNERKPLTAPPLLTQIFSFILPLPAATSNSGTQLQQLFYFHSGHRNPDK